MASYEQRSYPGAASDTLLTGDLASGGLSFSVTAGTGTGYPDGSGGPFWVIIDYDNSKAEKIRVLGRVNDTFTVPASDGRGNDGTSAQAHSTGAKVRAVIAATDIQEANRAAVNTVGKIAAKGDLLAGSGANTIVKVTVGTNGQVLSADSTQTGGVKWYTIPVDAVGATASLRTLGTGAQQAAFGNHTHTNLVNATITTPTLNGSGGQLTLPAGPTTLVGRDTTDTLTNKTLTSPAINGSGGALTLPAGPTTLVGRDTTDTLTNKTINGATLDGASTVGGVSGTTLAADRTAWTAWIPTLGNLTSATIAARYLLVGKTLHLRVHFQAGNANATAPLTVTLPSPLVTASGTGAGTQFCPSNGSLAGFTIPASSNTLTSTNNIAAGASVIGIIFQGVIEVA